MGSLLDGKHSQRGNRFLPITEAYLEPSQKSKMQLFGENRTDLQSLLSVKLSENSKIVTVLCYHYRSTTQRHKLNNRATQIKYFIRIQGIVILGKHSLPS